MFTIGGAVLIGLMLVMRVGWGLGMAFRALTADSPIRHETDGLPDAHPLVGFGRERSRAERAQRRSLVGAAPEDRGAIVDAGAGLAKPGGSTEIAWSSFQQDSALDERPVDQGGYRRPFIRNVLVPGWILVFRARRWVPPSR